MDVSSIYGSAVTSLFDSIFGDPAKKDSSESSGKSISSLGMDTVSISDAAKEKLAAMTAVDSGEKNAQNETDAEKHTASGGNGEDSSSDFDSEAQTYNKVISSLAKGDSSNGSDSKAQSLKAKLTSLQTSLSRATGAEAAAINAQISVVISEIAALESDAA